MRSPSTEPFGHGLPRAPRQSEPQRRTRLHPHRPHPRRAGQGRLLPGSTPTPGPSPQGGEEVNDATNLIVTKLWSHCQVLRDDGLSYQDYLEQLTFLLFLKMADERAALRNEPQAIP